MSADSWAECPKCGKGKTPGISEPVREDYEIGIYNGEFFINYSGVCSESECDFEKHFKHTEKL